MKTALITGVSGKIGASLVKTFVKKGYLVLGQYNSRHQEVDKLKRELENAGFIDCFFSVSADLSKDSGVQKVISVANTCFPHISLFISNAGADFYSAIEDTSAQDLDRILSVNLKAPYLLAGSVLPKMRDRGNGRIIFISSIWGTVGGSMETAYSASKGGLISLTRALAKEAFQTGVTVNCVCPGVINTRMTERYLPDEISDMIACTPMGRLGEPKDVSSIVECLAEDKSDFITGQVITVDGGFTL